MDHIKLNIEDIVLSSNLATELDDDHLAEIGKTVIDNYEKDKNSMDDWYKELEEVIDLVKLKAEPKNYPVRNAANVKLPLILNASIQYGSRVYPEIIRNGETVEIQVWGQDKDEKKFNRAKRTKEYMNYVLLTQSNTWQKGTDKLVHLLPIMGTVLRKSYFNSSTNLFEYDVLLPYTDFVIHKNTKSLDKAPRISHRIPLVRRQIIEHIRAGLFIDLEVKDDQATDKETLTAILSSDPEIESDDDELSREHEFIEQHTSWDLDGDGYPEPYIITIHKESRTVMRIVARFVDSDIKRNKDDEIQIIKPLSFFNDFHFLPSPDMNFYSLGFGVLLLGINKTVNTILNQLVDAGHFANAQGGFMGRGLLQRKSNIEVPRGEYVRMDFASGDDIRRNIVSLDYKEPSATLFNLLVFLLEQGKELSTVSNLMSGQERTQNSPATTVLALIEQGLKVFNAINRRVFWAFSSEFTNIFNLIYVFGDPEEYAKVLDDEEAVLDTDFNSDDINIRPVADANMSSDAQRIAKIQFIMGLMETGEMNNQEVLRLALETIDAPRIEKLLQPQGGDGPDPKLVELQAKIEGDDQDRLLKEREVNLKEQDFQKELTLLEKKLEMMDAQVDESRARATQALAIAAAQEKKADNEDLKLLIDSALKEFVENTKLEIAKENRSARNRDVEDKSSD